MGIEQSGNQAEDSEPTLGVAPTSDLNGSSTGEIIGPCHLLRIPCSNHSRGTLHSMHWCGRTPPRWLRSQLE